MNSVDQPNPPVAQVEEDRVLVRVILMPDNTAGSPVEEECPVCVAESMHTDAPCTPRLGRREIRIRHDDSLIVPDADPLHARILVAMDSVLGAPGKHLLKVVGKTVAGREDEDVGDVVEEARPRPVVAAVSIAPAARA